MVAVWLELSLPLASTSCGARGFVNSSWRAAITLASLPGFAFCRSRIFRSIQSARKAFSAGTQAATEPQGGAASRPSATCLKVSGENRAKFSATVEALMASIAIWTKAEIKVPFRERFLPRVNEASKSSRASAWRPS